MDDVMTSKDKSSASGLINARLQSLEDLARSFNALQRHERTQKLAQALRGLDGELTGRAVTELLQAFLVIYRENPGLMAEARPAAQAFERTIDFGKLRAAAEGLSDYGAGLAMELVDPAWRDPVVLVNLLGIAAPVLNSLIRVLNHALTSIDFPPEFLASALFNTLSEIDAGKLGAAVTNAASLINQIHEGSLILGGDEPRFRAVFEHFAEETLKQVDGVEVANALKALAEDAELMAGVYVDLLLREPELLRSNVSAALFAANPCLRATSGALAQLGRLGDEHLTQVGRDMAAAVEIKEAASAVNSCARLFNRLDALQPALFGGWARELIASINREELKKALSIAARDAADAARQDQGVKAALAPEEIGRRLNAMIADYNRRAEQGGNDGRIFLTKVLSSIDPSELERALGGVLRGLVEALQNAKRSRSVLRPVASAIWRLICSPFAALRRRLSGGDRGEG